MEVAASPDDLVAFAQSVERPGARYPASSDHVLTTRLPDDHASGTMMSRGYHEPFVSCAVPTARTRLDLTTSVLVLARRPATLVAKQFDELTWWFGDRFRLGVGSGWNMAVFRALGVSSAERGPILIERARVIASLWAGGAVDYHGRHHTLTGVGIDPAPGTPPPPLWFSGHGSTVIAHRALRPGLDPNSTARTTSAPGPLSGSSTRG